MIKEMTKVQIIGPKTLLDEAVKVLHAASIVHIEEMSIAHGLEEPFLKRQALEKDKLEEKRILETSLDKAKGFLALLERPLDFRPLRISPEEAALSFDEMIPFFSRAKALYADKDALTEELSAISRYERLLRGFAAIVSRLGGFKNFEILGLTLERTRKEVLKLIESEVARITDVRYELHTRDLDEDTIGIVIAYPKAFDMRVRRLMTGEAITEIKLPRAYEDMPLLEAIKEMAARKEELPCLIADIEKEVSDISRHWYEKTEAVVRALEDAIEEIGVLSCCGLTKFCFFIEGWVPTELVRSLKDKSRGIFGERVLLRDVAIREDEQELIPVYIHNPGFLKPFELFLKMLPVPRYGSIDPTPYIALFFPTFFGLIVGDIGYGLVLFFLGLYLKKRFREKEFIRFAGSIIIVCGLSAALFGLFFGEFFGDLGERLGLLHPILFDRMKALKTFFVLTLGIGVGHVALGLLIAVINYMSRGKKKEAVLKLVSLALIGTVLFNLAVFFNYLPKGLLTPGLTVLGILLVIATLLEGILGPLEFIRTLGNIVSYARIMAVGTASVVVSVVANRVAGLTGDLVLGILAAGLLHTLNIMLTLISPTIQSIRLEYVEFLTKFYEPGGRLYKPFKKR
ncbi:MAG: hypothetical protein HY880_08010 [Deltaproteobacteria bacterium]|nr:hypothetical protein [Deltaproteobacteria bacterium]